MNSAASLAAGLPVGRRAVRMGVLGAYALPAIAAWALLGLGLGAIGLVLPPLRAVALALTAFYGGYYGLTEMAGRRGLSPPGRRWQVPQTMLIDAAPRRRVVVWGALLGPGFATRNPFAGFGMLPLAVAAMPGAGPAIGLGAAIGLAHGAARAMALVRDVRELGAAAAGAPIPAIPAVPAAVPAVPSVVPAIPAVPAVPSVVAAIRAVPAVPAVAGAGMATGAGVSACPGEVAPEVLPTHLDMVLKTIYWRRFDGAVLLAAAVTGIAASLRSFT